MPDQRWPRVIQHPLNYSSGAVLISGVRLEHRALPIVGNRLGLSFEVVQRSSLPVPPVQSIRENIYGREALLARVKIPHFIDRPQMIFRNESLQRFSRRNRRARARFGVVAVRASGILIRQPINRRNIFVRPGHFYAGSSCNCGGCFASGRQRRIRPFQVFENPQIHVLHVGRRRPVTAIQPHEHARMLPQNVYLALERRSRDIALIRMPVLPAFPRVATRPAGHHQNPQMIRLFVKFLAIQPPFQSNRIQPHIPNIRQIRIKLAGHPPKQ